MKKIIFSITAAALVLGACNLKQYPISEVAADAYVKDAKSVENLVLGTYNGLYDVAEHEWAMTELRSDNARMRVNQSTAGETKLIEQLDQGTIISANKWVQEYWDAAYRVINRANSVFPYLEVVEDDMQRKQLEGEVRFLRAFMYFKLVRLWGPVFIVTKKTGADEARHMQRSPVDEVYAVIESDLKAIVDGNLLPLTLPDAQKGRADLKAAKALLAEVYATHYTPSDELYAQGATLLDEVLEACGNPAAGTQLVPYDKVFATDNEMNAEIVFAIRYRSGKLGIGSPFTTLFAPINNGGNVAIGSPKHYNFPSDNLIAAYNENPGDLRKDVTLQESYYNATTGQIVTNNARYCSKYIDKKMTSENDAENDFPVIRLGGVMLLKAEMDNEMNGPTPGALTLLNAIRQRAGVPDYSAADLNSRYAFREAVRKERRLELAMENQRWFDLLRWGTAVSTVNSFFASEAFYGNYDYTINPIAAWQTLLPIPVSVRDINKEVAQNPGY